MKTAKFVVVLVLLAIASIARAQTTNAAVHLSRLTEAVNAINENQLARAEELLNSVLATSRNDADALNLLGVVRAKQDRIGDAERLFRRALASLPSHVSAHVNLAELLLTHDRAAEAMPILLRAHKLAPARPDINLNLATLYVEKNDYQQAYDYLRLVPQEAINDDYFRLMVRTLVGLKQYDKAEEYLTSALRLKPNDVATLRALGKVARASGNLEKALSH